MKAYSSPLGDLYIGSINEDLSRIISTLTPSGIVFIADEHTASLCLPLLKGIMDTSRLIIIPPGEPSKNLDSCRHIWSSLIAMGVDRNSLMINVGGGMITDLGGFAAACFQRGVRFGHIPTTVLAMADAAIGGKTGVDFEGYKNYIGRTEPPAFIWIDPVFIQTLSHREILNGLTEITKHAIIGSKLLWERIDQIRKPEEINWAGLFEENARIKLQIVEADPYEKGLRKVLNFGHTIGHALESHFLGSSHQLSHGESIVLGMMAESRLANQKGLLIQEDFERIIELICRLLGPREVPLPSEEALWHWMRGDKKNDAGNLYFSLPDKIGSCGWHIMVEPSLIHEGLEWAFAQVKASSHRLSVDL